MRKFLPVAGLLAFVCFTNVQAQISPVKITPKILPQVQKLQLLENENLFRGPAQTCVDGNDSLKVEIVSDSNYNGTDLKCAGSCSGFFSLKVQHGSGNYSYSWSGTSNGTSTTNSKFEQVCDQLSITVVVRDNVTGIECVAGHNLSAPFEMSPSSFSTTPPTCKSSCDGSAQYNIFGGTHPYKYNWSNGENTKNANSLCFGTTTLTITDDNGCTFDTSVVLVAPPAMDDGETVQSPICNGTSTGYITLKPNSGDGGPYTYDWVNPALAPSTSNDSVGGLAAGDYSVVITDGSGCVSDTFKYSLINPADLTISIVEQVDPVCLSNCVGKFSVDANGGTGNYTYAWFQGTFGSGTVIPGLNDSTSDNTLCGQTDYFVVVTDAAGCADSIQFSQLNANPAITITPVTVTQRSCPDVEDGAIDITPTGGAGSSSSDYTYTWTGLSFSSSSDDISGLASDTYSLNVADGTGCEFDTTITINNLDSIFFNASITNITCTGKKDGAIDNSPTGGNGGLVLDWSSCSTTGIVPGVEDQSGLEPGTYCATITDSKGCKKDTSYIFIDLPSIGISAVVTEISCSGSGCDGAIDITASNGNGSFTYTWATTNVGNSVNGSTNEDETGLCADDYTISVTNAGCTVDTTITLAVPNGLNLDTSASQPSCSGADGKLNVTISGGSGTYPVIQWYTGSYDGGAGTLYASGTTVNNVPAGTYELYVEDNGSCRDSIVVTLTSETNPTVSSVDINPGCDGDNTGTIDATITGGAGPYQNLNWTGPISAVGEDLFNAPAGTYTLTGNDSKDCPISYTTTLTDNPPIVLSSFTIIDQQCANQGTGGIQVNISGGVVSSSYSYNWAGPNGYTSSSQNLTGINDETYCLTVTDDNLCQYDTCFTIAAATPIVITTASSDPACGLSDGEVSASATGGASTTGTYSFVWKDAAHSIIAGQTNDTLSNISAACYWVLVSDDNNCVDSAQICINDINGPTIQLDSTRNALCNGICTGLIHTSTTVNMAPLTLIWTTTPSSYTGPTNVDDINNLCGGTYALTATDGAGCQSVLSVVINEPNAIDPNIAITQPTCFGQNGIIKTYASGGTAPYTYDWNNDGTGDYNDPDSLIGSDGTYNLSISDSMGCTHTATATITEPTQITAQTGIVLSDCGSNGGAAAISNIAGGTVSSTYNLAWFNSGTTTPQLENKDTLANQPAGCYDVLVSDDNSCSELFTVCISDSGTPILSSVITNVTCFKGTDGQIDLNITGGKQPIASLSWNGPNGFVANNTSDSLITGLSEGYYNVLVTDGDGCTATRVDTVGQADQIVASTAITNPSCASKTDGAIDITIANAALPLTSATWTPSNNNSEDVSGLAAGQHCVKIVDANGCALDTCFNLHDPAPIALITGATTSGCGSSTGQASVIPSGGNATSASDYTYLWTGGTPNNTQTISSLAPGPYTVTVTDLSGCSQSGSVTVGQSDSALVQFSSAVHVSCHGQSTGAIYINVSGGQGPYNYDWDNDGTGDNDDAQDLLSASAGCHKLIITDANGCISRFSYCLTEPTAPLAATSTKTNLTCFNDHTGSIDLSVTGGTTGYNYNWTYPDASTSNVEDVSNGTAGAYCVTITDNNGCSLTRCDTLVEPNTILMIPTVVNSACGKANGSITLTTSGGTEANDYDYEWRYVNGVPVLGNGLNTIGSLPAGAYTIYATDDNGCKDSLKVALSDSTGPTTTSNSTDVKCFGDPTGSITVSASGQGPPFIFDWFNSVTPDPGNTATVSGLGAGIYTMVVEDTLGCKATLIDTIFGPDAPLALASITKNLTCHNDTTGEIDVTITGGSAPYTIQWSGPNSFNSSAMDITNLFAGKYAYAVMDSNKCTISDTITIAQPDAMQLDTTIVQPTCGQSNGSASVSVTGGTPGYTYVWANSSASVIGLTNSVNNLASGNYGLVVIDSKNCSTTVAIPLSNSNGPTVDTAITHVACHGDSTGAINITVGGTTNFSVNWVFLGGTSSDEDLNNLPAGFYALTVTDNTTGCITSNVLTVQQPSAPLAVTGITKNLDCFGDLSGEIDITASGGTPNYNYNWAVGSASPVNQGDQTNRPAGYYELEVSDANGCLQNASFTLTEPKEILLSATSAAVFCRSDSNGVIKVTASQGHNPYTYDWAGSIMTGLPSSDSIFGLVAGNYSISVTDSMNCSKDSVVVVEGPNPMVFDIRVINSSCNQANGKAYANVSGGVGLNSGHTYNWVDDQLPATVGLDSMINATYGQYTLFVTDSNSCTSDTTFNISNANAPQISIDSIIKPSCYGGSDGSIGVSITNANSSYDLYWNPAPNSFSEDLQNRPAGTYTLTVIDSLGCTSIASATISDPDSIAINSAVVNAACSRNDGQIQVQTSGGTGPLTLTWNTGSGNPNSTLFAGVYTATVTDSLGCTKSKNIVVNNASGITGATITTTDVSCHGFLDGSATVVAIDGVEPIDYYWIGGNPDTANTQTGLGAGEHFVQMTDSNNCQHIAIVTINSPSELLVTSTINPSTCGKNDGTILVSASGGNAPYVYDWTDNSLKDTTYLVTLGSGIYTLEVTDNNGCSANFPITLSDLGKIDASIAVKDAKCYGNSTGQLIVSATGNSTLSYQWSSNSGATLTGETNPTLGNQPSGNYIVEISDTAGCSAFFAGHIDQPDTLQLQAPITASVSCKDACNGQATVMALGGTLPYNYIWTSGNTMPLDTGLCLGATAVTLTDANGCSASRIIEISGPPSIIINVDSLISAQCAHTTDGAISVSISGGSGSGYSTAWSTADNSFSSTDEDISGLSPQEYILTVTDGKNCSTAIAVMVDTITVITAYPGANDTICPRDTVPLVGKTGPNLDAGGIWLNMTGDTLNSTKIYKAAPESTTSYIFKALDGICYDFDTIQIDLHDQPIADAGEDVTILPGSQVTLGGHPTGPDGSTYSWTPTTDMDELQALIANPNVLVKTEIDYIVTVTDPNSCIATDTVRITPLPGFIPATGISPNADGKNDTWQIPGISEFPEATVEIYNRWGKLIFQSDGYHTPWDAKFEGTNVPVGTYYYVINLNHKNYPDALTGPITVMY